MDLNARLARLQKIYIITASVFALLVATAVVVHKYDKSRDELVRKLQKAKTNIGLMRNATADTRQLLTSFCALIPPGQAAYSPERLLFARVDELKSSFPDALLTLGNLEDKGDEFSLSFVCRGTMVDYSAFLGRLGRLESSVLPVVQVKSLAITQAEEHDQQQVIYQLDGFVKMPKSAAADAGGVK
jgi:hypothetical protein